MAEEPVPLIRKLTEARRLLQMLTAEFDEKLAGEDVTDTQAVVLVQFLQQDKVSQTAIVEATHIDRSTLADVVRRLVEKGWLRRRRSKHDARAYVVTLTEEGRRLAEMIIQIE
jgi:DNA-binding MarR family transcriptional regulator